MQTVRELLGKKGNQIWSVAPDSQMVKRTAVETLAVMHASDVRGSFQTCMVDSTVAARMCRLEWVQSPWELRLEAWRWVRGFRYTQVRTVEFVVQ